MATVVPRTANEFIEEQLDERAKALARVFQADVLGLSGPLILRVDDLVKSVVETMKQKSNSPKKLVVVLTTRGGYIEVVKRIVETFRHHYEVVDFVVPNHAFSAGTVLVMSGDAIYMNYYSRLGPIDPQVESSKGVIVSALGYLEQWQRLVEKAKNGTLTTAEAQLMLCFLKGSTDDYFTEGVTPWRFNSHELSTDCCQDSCGKNRCCWSKRQLPIQSVYTFLS